MNKRQASKLDLGEPQGTPWQLRFHTKHGEVSFQTTDGLTELAVDFPELVTVHGAGVPGVIGPEIEINLKDVVNSIIQEHLGLAQTN